MIRSPRTLPGQLAAYAFGGGGITLLHSLIYWTLAEPGAVEPYLANTVAALIAGATGYLVHSRWTFGHSNDASAGVSAALRYVIVSVACYALNQFWVWLMVDQLGLSVTMSLLPMVLATPWLGFALNRWWTFRA